MGVVWVIMLFLLVGGCRMWGVQSVFVCIDFNYLFSNLPHAMSLNGIMLCFSSTFSFYQTPVLVPTFWYPRVVPLREYPCE